MSYTPEQLRIIRLSNALSRGYAPRVRQALLEAEAVESSFRNLNYGDRDSLGVLQQRPSQGWSHARSPAGSIRDFLARASALQRRGFQGSAGALAQAVQHSAFPGRYDQHAGEAQNLLGGAQSPSAASGMPGVQPGASGAGGGREAFARQLLAAEQHQQPFDIGRLVKAALAARQPSVQPGTPQNPAVDVRGTSVTPNVRHALGLAREFLGTPYKWGGAAPGGFDCSGLLQYVWGKSGVRIPRTSQQQWRAGVDVPLSQLRPGDAVFFEPGSGGPGHVAMYIGGGRILESPHTGAVVRITALRGRHPIGARRFA